MPGFRGLQRRSGERLNLSLLPIGKMALFRQFAQLPQAIENISITRMQIEPGLGQTPQLRISAIVSDQLLLDVEHRRCQGNAVEDVVQRVEVQQTWNFAFG